MNLIAKDKLSTIEAGMPTVSDKYDVTTVSGIGQRKAGTAVVLPNGLYGVKMHSNISLNPVNGDQNPVQEVCVGGYVTMISPFKPTLEAGEKIQIDVSNQFSSNEPGRIIPNIIYTGKFVKKEGSYLVEVKVI